MKAVARKYNGKRVRKRKNRMLMKNKERLRMKGIPNEND